MLSSVELKDPEFTQSGTELFLEVNVDLGELLNDLDFTTDLITHTGNNLPLAEKITHNVQNAFSLE